MNDHSGAEPPPPRKQKEGIQITSPLYTPAEQIVRDMEMRLPWPDGDPKHLLELLWSGNPVKGEEGVYRTKNLHPDQRLEILKQLFWLYDSQVMEKAGRAKIWFIPGVYGSCGSVFALLLFPLAYPLGLALLCLACGYYTWDQRRKRIMTRKNLETLLKETDDLRLLPVALTFPRMKNGRPIALKETLSTRIILLKRLLPLVREEEARHAWPQEQIHIMVYLLQTPFLDVELTLAMLRVLGFVGNHEALPVVERLVRRTESADMLNVNLVNERIHTAAVLCLDQLRARLRPMEQAATLLRASISPDVSPKELLRAANADAGVTPQGELLRAYTSPKKEQSEPKFDITRPAEAAQENRQVEQRQGSEE